MQVLKEELKNGIIEAAKDEFYLKGYEKASMRGIAGKAGITAGNLYRYFKNKDELFESIVNPVYNILFHHIEHHNDEHDSANQIEYTEEVILQLIDEGSEKLSQVLNSYWKNFLILIDGSKGTKYEGAKELVVNRLVEHMEKDHSEAISQKIRANFSILARAVSTSFIEGYLDIIRSNGNSEQTLQVLKDYTYVMLTGLVKVLV